MNDIIEIPAADYTIEIHPRLEYDQNPAPRIYIADAVASARSADLARLAQQEKELGGQRFADRGELSAVDALYDRLNAEIMRVKTAVAQEALVFMAADVTGDVDAAIEGAFFSRHAGCEMCPCSPGVIAGVKLTIEGGAFDAWVEQR